MSAGPAIVSGASRELSGWARYPRARSRILDGDTPDGVPSLISGRADYVARGNARAYGDAAIGLYETLLMGRLDRFRAFDPGSGLLTVEAGVLLAEILRVFVPRGFFPPVVPGTQFVTVGGMIAADVHGKNHHRDGGFGAHVEALTLVLPDGTSRICSRRDHADLFAATIGGMGLTGIVVSATFRMRRIETGWISQRTDAAGDLDGVLNHLRRSADATYSVAWIDCLSRGRSLGRGLVHRGEHASRSDCCNVGPAPAMGRGGPAIPFDLPSRTLNRFSVGAFNALYYHRGASRAGGPELVPWTSYFFPLDGVRDWNRLYGRRGFLQHQCVIPTASAGPILAEILDRVARLGSASPLAVLKQLGPGGGLMSFPMEGYTLALDLPADAASFALLDAVDRLVAAAGGRLYLAKDSRQTRETFEAGYPALRAFRDLRRGIGAEGRLTSRLSARLGL